MARKIDLGNNFYSTQSRIIDQTANLLLGVKSTVQAVAEPVTGQQEAAVAVGPGTGQTKRIVAVGFAPGPAFGQQRVAADLDPPPLIVGQVQMEPVELVEGHAVDERLHLVDRKEVTGHVEHHAPPAEARLVDDLDPVQLLSVSLPEELAEGGRRRDHPFAGASAEIDAVTQDPEPIALGGQGRIEPEGDRHAPIAGPGDAEALLLQTGRKEIARRPQQGVGRTDRHTM